MLCGGELQIVYGDLNIKIEDPLIEYYLKQYDLNNDNILNVDDQYCNECIDDGQAGNFSNGKSIYYNIPNRFISSSADKKFRELISTLLVETGLLELKNEKAFSEFMTLYNQVKWTRNVINDWKVNHIDSWGLELEFKADYWKENVLPFVLNDTPIRDLPWFDYRYHDVISGLINNCRELKCALFYFGLDVFVENKVVPLIQKQANEMEKWKREIDSFLFGGIIGYVKLDCEEGVCPYFGKVYLKSDAFE